MKGIGNMKEIMNKNVDMKSSKQMKENAEKDVRIEENVICNVSENCKKQNYILKSENCIS